MKRYATVFMCLKHLAFITILSSNFSVYGQNINDYEFSLQYLEQLAKMDSTKVKKLERFHFFHSNKLDSNKTLVGYNSAVAQIAQTVNLGTSCTPDIAQWNLSGPRSYTQGTVPFNGLINSVIGDANDPNFRLMGAQNSGIWKWDATTSEWINTTDLLGIPGLGITDIIVNPCDPLHIIASTGSYDPNTSIGVGIIESFDKGDTWAVNNVINPSLLPVNYKITQLKANIPKSNCGTNDFFFFCVKENYGGSACTKSEIIELKYDGSSYTSGTIATPSCSSCDNTCNWFHETVYDLEVINNNSFIVATIHNHGANGHIQINNNGLWMSPISTGIPSSQKFSISGIKNNKCYLMANNPACLTFCPRDIYELNFPSNTINFIKTVNTTNDKPAELVYSDVSNLLYIGLANFEVLKILDLTTLATKTFQGSEMHADVRGLVLLKEGVLSETVLAATDGGISEITVDVNNINNSSVTDWSGVSMPTNQFFNVSVAQSISEKIYGGSMHQGVFNFGYVGTNWHIPKGGDGVTALVNPFDENIMFYQSNQQIISSQNINNNRLNAKWHTGQKLKSDPNNANIVYWTRGPLSNNTPGYLSIYDISQNAWKQHTQASAIEKLGAIDISNIGEIYVANSRASGDNTTVRLEKKTSINIGSFQPADLGILTINNVTQALRSHLGYNRINDIAVDPNNSNVIYLAISGVRTHWPNTEIAVPEEFRVIKSYDAGTTWIDVSMGLDATPCNELLFQRGTDGRVFVSNEFGVFYRDNSFNDTDDWQCFHEYLPAAVITGLDINYCTQELYASTFGNSIWKTDLSMLSSAQTPTVISSNTTWSYDNRIIYSDIRVKAGTQLNIAHSKLKLVEGVKIIVEPTAFLQILNSELTSLCEGVCWDGITVEGTSSTQQTVTNQGKAFISGSVISNAKSALNSLGIDETTGGIDWGQMGGILTVSTTTFLNNRRAAQFLSFENLDVSNVEKPNVSRFVDCNFIVDDNYVGSCGSNSPFITIFHNNGIEIIGCSFSDSRTGLTNPADARGGILSGESTYIVKPSTSRKCTFTNLNKAVEANNVQETNDFELEVVDAAFYNCETGIRLSDNNNESKIIRNYVEIGHLSSNSSFGIVLHNSSGFMVEENECAKSAIFNGFSRGFDILNTFNPNNPIANPRFSNITIYNNISKNNNEGFTAWTNASGKNLSTHPNGYGLEFLCNQNIGNGTDFKLDDCVKLAQGSPTFPAGNTFTGLSSNSFLLSPTATSCGIIYHNSTSNLFPPNTSPGIAIQNTPSLDNCNYTPLRALFLSPRIILSGNYSTAENLMCDDLRMLNLIPLNEPYSALNFPKPADSGGEVIGNSIFLEDGPNAIVDWVWVELREGADSTNILSARAALLQRDGDIVDTCGVSPVEFSGFIERNYFVSIRHRNHLGLMTATALALSDSTTTIDFSDPNFQVFDDTHSEFLGGVRLIASGDGNTDGIVNSIDRSDVWNMRNLIGYHQEDHNLDGSVDAGDRSVTWNNRNHEDGIP